MITITVRFGASAELTKDFPNGTTVGSILSDRSLQATLGFGSNVSAVIDGVAQQSHSPVGDGDVVTVETKANSKASLSEVALS